MGVKAGPRLVVFFSIGTTVQHWLDRGLFDRETAYLKLLGKSMARVVLLTYDASKLPAEVEARMAPLEVTPSRGRIHFRLYSVVAPILRWRDLAQCDLYRTTQTSGAVPAVIACAIYRKPLIYRCGYVRSLFYAYSGAGAVRILASRGLEAVAVRLAARVFTATEDDAAYLQRISGVGPERFVLVRNPVDIQRFRPRPEPLPWRGQILYVGRLHRQKNLEALVDAIVQRPDLHLKIVGDGPLRSALERRATTTNIEFLGALDNNAVPDMLRQCDVFVLPSHYEGNPKSLLEAMASGCAIIGSNSPGIRNLIADQHSGLLCDGTAAAITRSVDRYRDEPELRIACGASARCYIEEHYDARSVAAIEVAEFHKVLAERSRSPRIRT